MKKTYTICDYCGHAIPEGRATHQVQISMGHDLNRERDYCLVCYKGQIKPALLALARQGGHERPLTPETTGESYS